MTTLPFVSAALPAAPTKTAHAATLALDDVSRSAPFSKRTPRILVASLLSFFLFMARAEAAPAYVTNFTATRTTNGVTVQFSLASASNGVPYNFYKASSLTQKICTYLGPVFASNTYAFSNQPLAGSWYRLSGPPVTMAVAWGDD